MEWLTKFPVACDVTNIETVRELEKRIERRMFPIHCYKFLLKDNEMKLDDSILSLPHNTYIEYIEFATSWFRLFWNWLPNVTFNDSVYATENIVKVKNCGKTGLKASQVDDIQIATIPVPEKESPVAELDIPEKFKMFVNLFRYSRKLCLHKYDSTPVTSYETVNYAIILLSLSELAFVVVLMCCCFLVVFFYPRLISEIAFRIFPQSGKTKADLRYKLK